jgi:hypothetical protein
MLRQIERATGVTAGAVGLVGLLMFAFSSGTEESIDVSSSGGRTVIVERETPPLIVEQTGPAVGILLAGLPLLAGVAIGAWRHARMASTGSGLHLIVSTMVLWLVTILGGFSVGVFLFPACLFALVSLIACGLGRDAVSTVPER